MYVLSCPGPHVPSGSSKDITQHAIPRVIHLLEAEAARHQKEDERRCLISASVSSLGKSHSELNRDLSQPSSSSLRVRAFAYDPEEERRDARRRHRKKLAGIVVDQWKHFARDRLDVSTLSSLMDQLDGLNPPETTAGTES